MIYPPTCMTCDALVLTEGGLCGECRRTTPFVDGTVCQACGAPLMGPSVMADELCDDCLRRPRPWDGGRTLLVYRDTARRLVLGLKHADRLDLAGPLARWMAGAARPLLRPGMVVVPVPLHWRRRVRRRYNQSALLGRGLARDLALPFCPDALLRPRATPPLEGVSPAERFALLADAIAINPARAPLVAGRPVLVIDDVMTSGATLAGATLALKQAGAIQVFVLTLARAVKEA